MSGRQLKRAKSDPIDMPLKTKVKKNESSTSKYNNQSNNRQLLGDFIDNSEESEYENDEDYLNELENEEKDEDYSVKTNSNKKKSNLNTNSKSKSKSKMGSNTSKDSSKLSTLSKNIIKKRSKSAKRLINFDQIEEEDEEEENVEFLPCREKEQETIYSYVKKGFLTSGGYTGLYISGMPGTGKTACVKTVLSKLKQEAKKKLITPFSQIEVNGMKVTNINSVYKVIYDGIFSEGKGTSMKKCVTILDNFFKNRKDYDSNTCLRDINNHHTVLIIDEIDCLINKKQTLLYNIFNWTTYTQSKLIIISISNTLDLPEKLMPKISSRMGNNRLSFKPYQKDELIKILSVKIDSFELFSEDAIRLSAMKVAAVNGDLRRILQICKRAKEFYDNDRSKNKDKIEKIHILKATEDLFDSKVQKVIESLQLYEKLILAAILFQIKITMVSRVTLDAVFERFSYLYMKYSLIPCEITFQEYMKMIYNLIKMQIIAFTDSNSNNFISNFLIIRFYADEFTVVVGKDDKFKEILNDLS
jgi:Cdc6-like AAA superfamily ATPase